MPVVQDSIAPLDRQQLSERWEALFGDPVFGDFPGKVELTEFGEVLVNPPVGKVHAGVAGRAVELLRNALGGHAIVEASILTDIGVGTTPPVSSPTRLGSSVAHILSWLRPPLVSCVTISPKLNRCT